jgi:hypothetical protein
MYLLSVIKFPKWAIKMINSQMGHFLWNDQDDNKKYHLANWDLVCMKQEFGGLGVQNLRDFNLCLLASWIKRYHLDQNKIWRKIVDFKYDLSPNMLVARPSVCSPFWKGVMWAAEAAKMGYRWKLGNGQKIRFWCDVWFGNCSLAILFWDLFVIVNEPHLTVGEAWDGSHLKFTFRRTVSPVQYNRWLELVQIMHTVSIGEEEDVPVWEFHSSGTYSVSSFYAVINNRGVVPIHTPAVWRLHVPPRLQVFLWLFANNKILTRDNLAKRRLVSDMSCMFCSELESCHHLFFDCFVAKLVWPVISEILGVSVGTNFESVARWWLSNEKNSVINVLCTATIWSLWKLRNDMYFQGKTWPGVQDLFRRIAGDLDRWKILSKDANAVLLAEKAFLVDKRRKDMLRIAWR